MCIQLTPKKNRSTEECMPAEGRTQGGRGVGFCLLFFYIWWDSALMRTKQNLSWRPAPCQAARSNMSGTNWRQENTWALNLNELIKKEEKEQREKMKDASERHRLISRARFSTATVVTRGAVFDERPRTAADLLGVLLHQVCGWLSSWVGGKMKQSFVIASVCLCGPAVTWRKPNTRCVTEVKKSWYLSSYTIRTLWVHVTI